MIKKNLHLLATITLALMLTACEKLDSSRIAGQFPEFPETMENIPMEYGRFVAATTVPQYGAILWFEQADRTIIGVKMNWSRDLISKEVIRIERQ